MCRASGGSGYLGVITGGGSIENWNFGWMALNYLAAGGASTLTISGFAFESVPGTPSLAGQGGPGPGPAPIPEPGTLAAAGLLAGGAAFARWRKRRDEAQKAACSRALLAAHEVTDSCGSLVAGLIFKR